MAKSINQLRKNRQYFSALRQTARVYYDTCVRLQQQQHMEVTRRKTLETESRTRFESSCDKLRQHYTRKQLTPIAPIDYQPSKDKGKNLFLADGTLNYYM